MAAQLCFGRALQGNPLPASCRLQRRRRGPPAPLPQSARRALGPAAPLAERPTGLRFARHGGQRLRVMACASMSPPKSENVQSVAKSNNHPVGLTVVMKFGGSSVANAERFRNVKDIVELFPQERPAIVLSAMGKTTNKLLLAGECAVACNSTEEVAEMQPLLDIIELHHATAKELGLDVKLVDSLLQDLTKLLTGISLMKEVTKRTQDYLVSFGERMSTRLFAAYMTKCGNKAKQYDAWDIGFVSTDDFTNGDICDETYGLVRERLTTAVADEPHIPVITGFLARGVNTGAITTLGRGGSDLTATVVGRAMGTREVQVWKDVDGVLTSSPLIVPQAQTIPFLTFQEATELAYFGATVLHPQSMLPAQSVDLPVRVKNSYNPVSQGTLITKERDMSGACLTSIVCKSNITMLDIESTRMLGQYGFLAKVFQVFDDNAISVDVVATSEVSISLTLDPAKLWSRDLMQQELDSLQEAFGSIADVDVRTNKSIISLICNVEKSSQILEKVFKVLHEETVNVQMISQGASKVNISMIVDDAEADQCVQAIHREFFEKGCNVCI